ncbi:hypothetical protein AMS68_005830 [Peltaster fructicola]|uniref:Life-span regulatory factor domain-containing protein n=1 Tax=Peltaster fructicola TaxID=286661 RepID=A0A6H0XZX6_9PEZI|nr:hypothetical protein AMS68_005830 [Peltaster fructicola]
MDAQRELILIAISTASADKESPAVIRSTTQEEFSSSPAFSASIPRLHLAQHDVLRRQNRLAIFAYRGIYTSKRTSSHHSSSNGSVASRPISRDEAEDTDDEDEDMASFLQFCATCEKQIVTPAITVLYCSEACRRRDSTKSVPSSVLHSPPLSPSTAYHDYPPTIVPRRSPTILHPLSTTFSELSLYELNTERKSLDLDESTFGMPTEARPYLKRTSTSEESTIPSLVHSPASSYGTSMPMIDTSRPLPRKHSCTTHRGIELVTPIMGLSPSTADPRRKSTPVIAKDIRRQF